MEDPPPKLPWPGVDVEVEGYTSPPPHETKTISMRFVGRGSVGMVRETVQPAHVAVRLRPNTLPKGQLQHTPASRSTHCGGRLKTPLISVRLSQRLGGLPALISQSALRLSITTSRWVSSSQRSRKSSSSSGWSSPILSRHPSTQPST